MDVEEMVLGDGWISDDSSFYGDETEQERLDALCEEFRPAYAFSMRKNDLNAIVFKHCKAHCTAPLRNPGEGNPASWQLGETVEKFVRRLPPATTSINLHKWIWVYNPFEEKHKAPKESEFTLRGQELLMESKQRRRAIESNPQKKTKGTVTRNLNEESRNLRQHITDLAVKTNLLSGKWMLFLSPEDLTRFWRLVADGVINKRLGPAAKVATDDGKPEKRLVCIYTKDFRDKDDIRRVLGELVAMGVADTDQRPIHYKSDAYTHLNIYRETVAEYGLQASLYSSQKLLAEDRIEQETLKPSKQSSLNRPFKTTSR